MSQANYITDGGDWYSNCDFNEYCDGCPSYDKERNKCTEGNHCVHLSSSYIEELEVKKAKKLEGKVHCLKCEGKGSLSTLMGYRGSKCYDCRGTGYVTEKKRAKQEYAQDERNHIDALCPKCNGSGKYRDYEKKSNKNKCYTCGGKGKVRMCEGKIIYK